MLICEVFVPKLLRGGRTIFESEFKGGEWIFDLSLRGGEEIFYPVCCNPATCLLYGLNAGGRGKCTISGRNSVGRFRL